MTYQSSDQALQALIDRAGPPTSKQITVAEIARIGLPPELPRLVAAARLRDSLFDVLDTAAPADQNDYQFEVLEELARDADVDVPTNRTRAEAKAWILHCRLLLRIRAHKELRLKRGDFVRQLRGDAAAIDEVSSIDAEGRVWLRGRGRRLWPDQLEVVARASQDNDEAHQARRIAANRREISSTAGLTEAQRRELAPFCPSELATIDDLEGLRDVIDNAGNERPIQTYLDSHPQLLASVLRGPHRYVRSQVRLGAEYVPDYLLADADSAGLHWIYVELETPRSPVLLNDGKALHRTARAGVTQIRNWREWVTQNLAYARQPRAANGLGLPGIRPGDGGLVLVGRRRSLIDDRASVRRQLSEETGIAVHTYDWLLEIIERSMSSMGPPPGASHLLLL